MAKKSILKYTPQQRVQLREAVLMLRFRRTDPTLASRKYVAYNGIAKALGLSYGSVQHICRASAKPVRLTKKDRVRAAKREERTLTEEHINWLTGATTLE
jgi:hypothetical protein